MLLPGFWTWCYRLHPLIVWRRCRTPGTSIWTFSVPRRSSRNCPSFKAWHHTSRMSDHNSCFVFGRYTVQILVWRPAIPSFFVIVLRQMPGYLKLGHDRFLSYPYQFVNHHRPSFDAIQSELLTASFNKHYIKFGVLWERERICNTTPTEVIQLNYDLLKALH
jgi:hypothetical protein